MENMVVRVAVVLAIFICALVISWTLSPMSRESRDHFYPIDSYDCRHHCEWQVAKMNETFNTLIAVCEEKLQKLHSSDMNMAIIREQLHKEILELFSYEFQTFQRLHNTKAEYVPQLCSDYCTTVSLAKHRDECKENMTKLLNINQQLVQAQRWLRLQLILRLRQTKPQVETTTTFLSTNLWAITVLIIFVMTIIIFFRVNKDKVAALETERERIETEMHTLREHNVTLTNKAQLLTANLQAHRHQTEELILDKENFCNELEARNTILTAQQNALLERNGFLEYWNDNLYTEVADLQIKIDNSQNNLSRMETALQNAHRFWQLQQSKERKARQEFEEELENTIKSLKRNELKHERELAKWYQEKVNELETQRHMNESLDKRLQNRVRRQRELEANVRDLECKRTALVNELEKWKMRCDMEKEGKRSALERVYSLEREVTALKAQTARLTEGLETKSYRSSRPLRFLRQSQTSNSVEILDSRLDDMRKEFDARFEHLRSKFESQQTRDSEELHKLRIEHEELCKQLEIANEHNAQLQSRVARQEPEQPLQVQNNRKNKRSSHAKSRVHLAKEKLQRQISFSRVDDFRTQPEPTHISTG